MEKILLTGAGAPGGPGIIKALKQAGYSLVVCDANPCASGRYLHSTFFQIPPAEDEMFIEKVLNICTQQNIDIVFPLVTKELFHLSAAKAMFFENGIKVIVSDYESLAIANDKGRLYQHLKKCDVPVPGFHVVDTIDQLQSAVSQLGYPEIPVCIKPTISNGSRGVRILQNDIDAFHLLFREKPNHLYSTLDEITSILANRRFPTLLVSEYLPGIEYTIDAIVQHGEPKLILPRSRERMNNGISMQGTFIRNEQIIAYCDQIIRSLNLSGPIGLQVKAKKNGDFRLLEINPRIQGTSVAALGMGINLPALAVQQAFEPIEVDPSNLPWGTSFVRYYEEVFYT